jgi:hypothetical protein
VRESSEFTAGCWEIVSYGKDVSGFAQMCVILKIIWRKILKTNLRLI